MDESALELGARALAALAVDYLIAFAELSFLRFFPARRGQEGSQRLAEPIPGPTTERFQRKAREHVLEWDRLTNVRREARMPPREVLPGEIPRDGSALDETGQQALAEPWPGPRPDGRLNPALTGDRPIRATALRLPSLRVVRLPADCRLSPFLSRFRYTG